tara:strand:- start:553 stop:1038 length:486 start_codon:yes stop_codon:yes gene_type:complete
MLVILDKGAIPELSTLNFMCRLLLACFIAITPLLVPVATFASAADLSPAVSDIVENFSERFCTSIGNGMTPEKAGESAAAQLSPRLAQGFFFTPVMNEIIASSKEDLAVSASNNIFDGCGIELGGTKEELEDYLAQLANKIPSKSKGLNLPSVRQKEPLRQ